MGAPQAHADSHHHCSKCPMEQPGNTPCRWASCSCLCWHRSEGSLLSEASPFHSPGSSPNWGSVYKFKVPSFSVATLPSTEGIPVSAWRYLHSPDNLAKTPKGKWRGALGYFCSPNIHQDSHESRERSPAIPLQPCEGLGCRNFCPERNTCNEALRFLQAGGDCQAVLPA